jgi:hypothetical protein
MSNYSLDKHKGNYNEESNFCYPHPRGIGVPKAGAVAKEVIQSNPGEKKKADSAKTEKSTDDFSLTENGAVQHSVFVCPALGCVFLGMDNILNRDFNARLIYLAEQRKLDGGNGRLAEGFVFTAFGKYAGDSCVGWEVTAQLDALFNGLSIIHAPLFERQNALTAVSGLHLTIISFTDK